MGYRVGSMLQSFMNSPQPGSVSIGSQRCHLGFQGTNPDGHDLGLKRYGLSLIVEEYMGAGRPQYRPLVVRANEVRLVGRGSPCPQGMHYSLMCRSIAGCDNGYPDAARPILLHEHLS